MNRVENAKGKQRRLDLEVVRGDEGSACHVAGGRGVILPGKLLSL